MRCECNIICFHWEEKLESGNENQGQRPIIFVAIYSDHLSVLGKKTQ